VSAPSLNDTVLDQRHLNRDMQQLGQQTAELVAALGELSDIDTNTAPRDVVWQLDKVKLYRYCPQVGVPPTGQAVLICYSLINRPWVLDLQPDRSLIRGLLARGLDVFLIDWGCPDGADRLVDLNEYLNRYLHGCVQKVMQLRGESQINLLGVCQGGTFSLCYAALYPQQIRKLITLVTPVDFQTPDDLLSKWVRHVDVPALVAAHGNVPSAMLNGMFVSLMPFRLLGQKYMNLLNIAQDRDKLSNFMRMEKWIFDSPDQAGAAFAEFVTALYQQNRLVNDTFSIAGRKVLLRRITAPVFNVYGTLDFLVPSASSRRLSEFIPAARYRELAMVTGHVGMFVSARSQSVLPSAMAEWLCC